MNTDEKKCSLRSPAQRIGVIVETEHSSRRAAGHGDRQDVIQVHCETPNDRTNATPTVGGGLRLKHGKQIAVEETGQKGGLYNSLHDVPCSNSSAKFDKVFNGSSFSTSDGRVSVGLCGPDTATTHRKTTEFPGLW